MDGPLTLTLAFDFDSVYPTAYLKSFHDYRYPPGHGDVFPSLLNSGKLDALLSKVFVCTRY